MMQRILPEQEMKLKWIESAGGPLILMPEELLSEWSGINPPADGRIIEATSRWHDRPVSDYDRACEINEYHGVIKVAMGDAWVMGDTPDATTWWADPKNPLEGGFLIRWLCADNEEEMIRHFPSLTCNIFSPSITRFSAGSGRLVLFDSASPGTQACAEEKGCLRILLSPGDYAVAVDEFYFPDPHTEMLVHHFQRASS
jgi:hypothetical protein